MSRLTYDSAMALLEESVHDDATPSHVRSRLVLVRDFLGSEVISVGAAAKILGISPNTVKNWIALGRFPSSYQTDGSHWRLSSAEVLAFRDASARARAANAAGEPVRQTHFEGDPYDDGLPD